MKYEEEGFEPRGIKINFTHAKKLQIIFAAGHNLKINNNSRCKSINELWRSDLTGFQPGAASISAAPTHADTR